MATSYYHNLPRIFTPSSLFDQALFDPGADAGHHLVTVLRAREDDTVRLFNGHDGEWLARVTQTGKKACELQCMERLLAQPAPGPGRTLVFAPIKKTRMDFLIEKAVELGVTHLQPVWTQNTQMRTLKCERIEKQIISAAEQCERLDIPELADPYKLEDMLARWPDTTPLLSCIARLSQQGQHDWPTAHQDIGILIGPEGGFTNTEIADLQQKSFVRALRLSANVLRSETAAIAALSLLDNFSG